MKDDEEERRNGWPESCPLSEEELRAALRREAGEIQAIAERMEALHGKLPELDDEAAATVYSVLRDVLGEVHEDLLSDAVLAIGEALEVMPESLREQQERLRQQQLEQWRRRVAMDGPGFIEPG